MDGQISYGDSTPLDSISGIADEAERCAGYIEAFITRFHHGGVSQVVAAKAAQLTPLPSGHAGQIQRLRDAVASVDKLARELQTIG